MGKYSVKDRFLQVPKKLSALDVVYRIPNSKSTVSNLPDKQDSSLHYKMLNIVQQKKKVILYTPLNNFLQQSILLANN